MQMLHEPHNRAMWHTDCEAEMHASPMKPLTDTKNAGDAKLQLWECASCHKKSWFGYSDGQPVIEPHNAELTGREPQD